ncbi:MAG TPA: AMP-binding protein [Acidimicrobiales bacterium]|nr:AMP-binding protein [Acidimicrobiales bacterium]
MNGLKISDRRPPIPGGGPQSVAEVLDLGLRDPDREALVARHGRLTYGELDAQVDRAAGALRGWGLRPGDRVAASLGNHLELAVAFLAAMRLGALWVGVNKALAPPEVAYLLGDAGASLFLGDRGVIAAVAGMRDVLPELRAIVDCEPGDTGSEWAAAVAAASPAPRPPVDPFGPAAIAYTSGTTGRPKGVVHSQHNLLLPGAVGATRSADPDARTGVCLPLTILNLVVLGPLVAFQSGRPCVLMDRVDAVGIASWVRDERITSFAAVPTMIHDLLTHPELAADDLASLTRPGVGGAAMPESFRELYRDRFGTRVTTGYGLTEAPTSVTQEDPSLPPVERSCGRALPQVRITIREPDGRELPAGSVGEVCVEAAPNGPFAGAYTPMLGYWRRPDATAEALHGEVLRTGDLGFLSPDGDLFVTDRKNDLILRGGANVYPAEVERVLQEVDGVAGSAVLGVPDERLGERVVAAVELAPGASVTERDLLDRCAASLARYKVPERIVFVDGLPRNAMGKVVKREVRALVAPASAPASAGGAAR